MCTEAYKVQCEMIDFLSSDRKERKLIYDRFAIPKVSFIENIFSMRNFQNQKIIRVLGFVIKFKRF